MKKVGSCSVVYDRDVDSLCFDWGKVQILSETEVTGAQRMSFGVVALEVGKGHLRHNHPEADEIIYVVSGKGEQMLDDKTPVEIGPGACIHIPQAVYHSTVNTGSEILQLVIAYAPAGAEQVLRSIPGCQIKPPTKR